MVTDRPPRLYRTGTQVALGVTVSFFLGSVILTPIWQWITRYFHPKDFPAWDEGWSLGEFAVTSAAILLIGAVFGGIFGVLIGRATTGRLTQIASEASVPFGPQDPLPGPFDETGRGEIAQLAHALNHMRSRAMKVMKELTTRDQARSEWVAQVSHDLRTPLAALTASLDLIERRLEQSDTKELSSLVGAAQIDTERVTHLALDLLEIARLEVSPKLQLRPTDPGELAEHAVRELKPLAVERNIQLSSSNLSKDMLIEADGRLLLRALENLLANSIQHARSQVTLTTAPTSNTNLTAHAVRFTVDDDGPGLPETNGVIDFADLKDHRSRADSSGLGLIVTARVAELHGSRVHAENPTTGGARIAFEIARAKLE